MIGDYITLSAAARHHYPKPIHASGAWRHARRGVRCANGQRVHLKHVRAGGVIYTTAQWVNEFFEAIAAADMQYFAAGNIPEPSLRPRTSGAREKAVTKARAELHAMGV